MSRMRNMKKRSLKMLKINKKTLNKSWKKNRKLMTMTKKIKNCLKSKR
jgi:hypothetical protein